jgi:molybdopterin-binding protein
VTYFRVSQAAALFGVSDDTVRRYISLGRLPVRRDEANRRVIDGVALAAFARATMTPAPDPSPVASSARNRLVGVVTDLQVDKAMAQVEMQCGPHRVVSLISREAVDDMGLKPGVLAVAMIKSTNVVVEVPDVALHRPDGENEDSSTE